MSVAVSMGGLAELVRCPRRVTVGGGRRRRRATVAILPGWFDLELVVVSPALAEAAGLPSSRSPGDWEEVGVRIYAPGVDDEERRAAVLDLGADLVLPASTRWEPDLWLAVWGGRSVPSAALGGLTLEGICEHVERVASWEAEVNLAGLWAPMERLEELAAVAPAGSPSAGVLAAWLEERRAERCRARE